MLVVQTATYNEAEIIEQLIDQIQSVVPKAQVLVVDDNSPDGTGKIVSELMTTNDALHLVERVGHRGLGSAILKGIETSASLGAEIVVYMDADLSHNPSDILPFVTCTRFITKTAIRHCHRVTPGSWR